MAIKHTYNADGGVLITGTGVVTATEVFDRIDSLYATAEQVSQIRYLLIDFTAVSSWKMTPAEIVKTAQLDRNAVQINPAMIITIAANDERTYGLSRMWEAYLDSSPLQSRVFKTVADCEAWLASLSA